MGLNENHETKLAFQLWWPKKFITEERDDKGTRFGDKTATLEQIAILLPLLLIPECLFNQHIIVRTDNITCVFGHENHLMKKDETASIFIRSVHLISAFLAARSMSNIFQDVPIGEARWLTTCLVKGRQVS